LEAKRAVSESRIGALDCDEDNQAKILPGRQKSATTNIPRTTFIVSPICC
jgi:hypothetical protein